jgi:hypothetical protein
MRECMPVLLCLLTVPATALELRQASPVVRYEASSGAAAAFRGSNRARSDLTTSGPGGAALVRPEKEAGSDQPPDGLVRSQWAQQHMSTSA